MERAKANAISKVATCFSRRILVFSNLQPKVNKGTEIVISVIKMLEKGVKAFKVELQTLSTGTLKKNKLLAVIHADILQR